MTFLERLLCPAYLLLMKQGNMRTIVCWVALGLWIPGWHGWAQADFNPDSDGNGLVGMMDLMEFLTHYGMTWPPEVELDCGGEVSFAGFTYGTVQIGNQCWFAENVRYLPVVYPPSQGWEDDSGAHAYVLDYYGSSVADAMTTSGYQTFGVIYDGPAVQQWTLCPSGWHLPTSSEWLDLLETVGGQELAGPALKSDIGWNGTNSSGFGALPGGARSSAVGFLFDGSNAWFWGAEPFGSYSSQGLQLYTYANEAILDQVYSGHVRCIRDAP
jgi:uncharacterized protein (TIGR02145 family)